MVTKLNKNQLKNLLHEGFMDMFKSKPAEPDVYCLKCQRVTAETVKNGYAVCKSPTHNALLLKSDNPEAAKYFDSPEYKGLHLEREAVIGGSGWEDTVFAPIGGMFRGETKKYLTGVDPKWVDRMVEYKREKEAKKQARDEKRAAQEKERAEKKAVRDQKAAAAAQKAAQKKAEKDRKDAEEAEELKKKLDWADSPVEESVDVQSVDLEKLF